MADSAFSQVSATVSNATFVTTDDETSDFSNSFSLGSLSSGVLKHTVAASSSTPAVSTPLTSIDGLTTAADKMIYTTASDTYAVADLTSFARTLLDDANASSMRSTLGLGTMAIENIGSITTSMISDTDNADDLGSASFQWANLFSVNVNVGTAIIHTGDTDNKIVFGTDTQDFQTGGLSRMDLSDSGMRLGGANSRVTTVLDEDNMASDSATALSTQQAIKKYVDDQVSSAGGGLNKITTVSAAGAGTIDFDNLLDSTYNAYLLVIDGFTLSTDLEDVEMIFGTGATPTWQTSSYYHGNHVINDGGAEDGKGSSNTSQLFLTNSAQQLGNDTGESFSANVNIYNTQNSNYSSIIGNVVYLESGTDSWGGYAQGMWANTTTVTSLRLEGSAGNATAEVTLYGYQK